MCATPRTQIPRTLRMMYIHAYQSYLFNVAASARAKAFGVTAVVAGDLVIPRSTAGAAAGGTTIEGGGDDDAAGGKMLLLHVFLVC